MSLEGWEAVNELHLWMEGDARQATQMCLGVVHGTMLHDNAFDFLLLGVMLERTSQTARILHVHHHALASASAHQVVELALWLALLRACSGFEPFMKRFQGRASAAAVARFLVLDGRFPRSVSHCLHDASKRLARVHAPDADLRGRSLSRLRALEPWTVDEAHGICDEIGRELFGYPAPPATGATDQ